MEHKTLFGKDAKDKIKEGVDLVANAVKVTMGKKGRNVMCLREGMLPVVTKDGVSVAKEVDSADVFVSAGASAVKQVATQTNDLAGDGTTTASVLAQSIINEAYKLIDTVNPISLKKGIELATQKVVQEISRLSIKKQNFKTLKNIALISSNGDKEIADLVVEAIKKVGLKGTVKIETVEEIKSSVDVEKGYELDSPFTNYKFITNPETLTAEIENCHVLIYEGYLETEEELNSTLELLSTATGILPLLIISDNISTDLQNKILAWRLSGVEIMNIKSPSFGARRTEVLKDIVSVIGGKVYTQESLNKLSDVTLEGLGKIKKVVTDADKTILIGGQASKERVDEVTQQVKVITGGKKEKDFAKERLSKLTSGVAVINVGGYSTVERREKEDRVTDALCAVRACLEEGYVAGGGVTYLYISEALKTFKFDTKNEDEKKGVALLLEAIASPFRQILLNAGVESAEKELEIRKASYGTGFNVETERITNMIEDGVIDPAKVTRLALENAASISGTFLTTEVLNFNSTPIFTK